MFTPSLNFDGNAAEAIDFYTEAFEAITIKKMQYKDMPPNPDFPVKPEQMELILHAELDINGHKLIIHDNQGTTAGTNMAINVTGSVSFVKNVWTVLKEGADTKLDLAPTFFASLHGALTDKFGITWMLTAHEEQQ